jgi:adenylosuccinate synthase
VLTGLDTVKICVAYECEGKRIENYPANLNLLKKCKPIYEELPGWKTDITGVRSYSDLPEETKRYVERISQLTGIPIAIFSVGPDRDQTIQVRPVYA